MNDRSRYVDLARSNSVGASSVIRRTRTNNMEARRIKAKILSIVLSATVIVGSVTLVKNAVDNLNSPLNMTNLSREIGGIVNVVENDILDIKNISIVNQNTHRNGDTFFYNQEDIAKDLLKLDSRLFDYAFCTVCTDMAENINNKVGIGGRSNIDSVIYYLKQYASGDGKLASEYVAEEFKDINSLNEYLVKNGYVNKKGEPSLDKFIEVCNENAEIIRSVLDGESEEKGANLA